MVDGEKEAKGIELNERQDRRTILRGGVFRYMDHEYASPELVGREGQFITLVTIDYGTMTVQGHINGTVLTLAPTGRTARWSPNPACLTGHRRSTCCAR